MLIAMQSVWRNLCRPTDHDTRVLATISDLVDVIQTDDNMIPLDVCKTLDASIMRFLQSYSWLGVEADKRNAKLFSATPKTALVLALCKALLLSISSAGRLLVG